MILILSNLNDSVIQCKMPLNNRHLTLDICNENNDLSFLPVFLSLPPMSAVVKSADHTSSKLHLACGDTATKAIQKAISRLCLQTVPRLQSPINFFCSFFAVIANVSGFFTQNKFSMNHRKHAKLS